MIEVVTFDLWDTVFIDDSDEIKRTGKGLSPKPVERRNIIERYLKQSDPLPRAMIDLAYDTVDSAFRHVWYQMGVTWTVKERLEILLKGMARKVPASDFATMVRLHEEMELEIMPDLAPGIREAIEQLHGKYRLAVISDAIFSPGRVLRQILDNYDLLRYFEAFVFSDEAGCAKPDPKVFNLISDQLDIPTSRFVHIGDREEKDIVGPHAVSAKAILTTVVKDRGSAGTQADAICTDYSNLKTLISTLS
jgi:putative hydrolase of the HAD superfamily